MRRTVILLILCAVLSTPMMASADDQTIPPEAHWTPTPPARSTVAVNQVASVLVDTGMIIPQEYTHLTQPRVPLPSPHSRVREWTWDDLDHNPVRSTGGE